MDSSSSIRSCGSLSNFRKACVGSAFPPLPLPQRESFAESFTCIPSLSIWSKTSLEKWFLTNRLCPARICRLCIFTGQSLPCLEEVVRSKRFIYGVIYEFTKWQSDEGAVFTLVPFYMEITNMLFLFKSGTRTIQLKSARKPRWHMTPLFFWSDQSLSRISRDSTPQLSVVKPHVGMCVVKSQLPFHPRDWVHVNSQFSVEGQWVSYPRGSFPWLHFWACRMAPCKLSSLGSRTLWNQFIMLWAANDWEEPWRSYDQLESFICKG